MVSEFHPDVTRPDRAFSVLVADDDTGSRESLARIVRERGFTTRMASSGEEAIEIARAGAIDLVVFDLHMPRMTGLEALQQVRLFNSILPALLVTADATRDVIRQAQLAQVFSVIPKPVNANILVHLLRKALTAAYG